MKTNPLLKEKAFINGKWVDTKSGMYTSVINPADDKWIGKIPCLNVNEVKDAIHTAYHSFQTWQKVTANQRAILLRKWYELIIENKEDLAKLITLENGKPLNEARGEVDYAASYLDWFSEETRRIYGDIIPEHKKNIRLFTIKQPIGVVGIITPWNFPIAMLARKAAAAIAAGCTFIAKPSELTPFSALAFCELATRAGLPDGVVNVVTGDPEQIGKKICHHPKIRKVSFTGSTKIGRIIMTQCAQAIKKVSLELGGNAPFIVFDDADMDETIQGAIASKYRNTGQTCICTNRFLVQDKVYDTFSEKLKREVEKFKVGNGMDEDVVQGPLINNKAIEKIQSHVDDCINKGGRLLTGGCRHTAGGNFYKPTVLCDLSKDMKIMNEETFGPVAAIYRFSTEAEAISIANATESGLAAYVYTSSIGRLWRVAEALEYGMVGVNEGSISSAQIPFGGVKQSGIGREGSKYGIEDYMEIKYICLGGIDK